MRYDLDERASSDIEAEVTRERMVNKRLRVLEAKAKRLEGREADMVMMNAKQQEQIAKLLERVGELEIMQQALKLKHVRDMTIGERQAFEDQLALGNALFALDEFVTP